MARNLLLSLLLLGLAPVALASDAYVVRFNAYGHMSSSGTGQVLWLDDVLFFNTNATPAVVTFLGVSNGSAQANPPALTLPPGEVVSLNASATPGGNWTPVPSSPLYVLHIDVPAGVIVESRDEFYFDRGIPELFPFALGKVSMPVFRGLVPAATPQVQLGTDLSGTASRLNVGIYNAGAATATATIEVRRTCDHSVTDSRTIPVPPNTLLQSNGFDTGSGSDHGCRTPALNSGVTRYTVITVSQPSLTYVSNLTDDVIRPAGVGDAAPYVGLSVTQNSRF